MLTPSEKIELKIKQLESESAPLKQKHKWGMWENWRKFVKIDIKINKLKIKLLELENESLSESLKIYKNY